MPVHHFVSPRAPLKTRATHLPGHTLTDYLQLCQHHFEGKPPLQPHRSPFLLLFTHKGGRNGHGTPRLRGVYATAHAKSTCSRPTEVQIVRGHGNWYHEALRRLERGGLHRYNRIQDIVEPCGQGRSGVIQRTSACFMPTGSLRYRGKGEKHGKSSTHVDVRQGGARRVVPQPEQT